jgi:hypothetical protein
MRYTVGMRIEWAASAAKHGISRARIRHVIAHCGLIFEQPAPLGSPAGLDDPRLVYLGDDAAGVPLEVMAIELDSGGLLVIHAMPLRTKYHTQYEEAKKWHS